ncbi:MAG: hypothetical protein P4L87_26695 [Formivibrio sp.]|nr:hypothetical protein [Formivibrio sp.]
MAQQIGCNIGTSTKTDENMDAAILLTTVRYRTVLYKENEHHRENATLYSS